MELQMVIFELANEHFGVDIADVESIIKMQSITLVPQAPAFVEGVTNLRGSILPVIDLRQRFGFPGQAAGKNSRIVVVTMGGVKVGMIVDAVSEVLRVSEAAIEPPPAMVTSIDSSFITGIAKMDERLIILLDLAKVLSINEQTTLNALAV